MLTEHEGEDPHHQQEDASADEVFSERDIDKFINENVDHRMGHAMSGVDINQLVLMNNLAVDGSGQRIRKP